MIFCNNCKVYIRENRRVCPLCGNMLQGDSSELEEIFPRIPPSYERHLAIRIMVFISIASIVTSFAFYEIFPININWPIFIALGLLSMWLSLIVILKKRHNIPKIIMWQVAIVSILSVIWEFGIGWRGLSLNYIIPISCVAAMFVMYVTAKVMKLSVRDYIIYLLLDGIFGIVPILFILFHWVDVFFPSIICVAVSIIFLSAIFIFQGENIKAELDKKLQI